MNRLLAALLLLGCLASAARASVTANSAVTPQTPNRGIVQFLQGTDVAGTYKTLYTAGANGSECRGIIANTNDGSAAHLVTLQIVNATVKYGGVAVNVPINSGFANGTPPVSLTANWTGLPIDAAGNSYVRLVSGDTLQATFATALTASDVLNIYASCADY